MAEADSGREPLGMVDALVDWGREHPVVRMILRDVPLLTRGGPGRIPAGLYVEASRAPWTSAKGITRVSVLRVVTAPRHGAAPVLLGQVHATELAGASPPGLTRRLRTCIQGMDGVGSREIGDVDAWWLLVLDRHYRAGGPIVEPAIPA